MEAGDVWVWWARLSSLVWNLFGSWMESETIFIFTDYFRENSMSAVTVNTERKLL